MSKLTVVGIREFLASRASNDPDSTLRDLTQMLSTYVEPVEPKAVEPTKPVVKKGILRSKKKDY